jgi:NADPH2:quinone reductase
VRWSPIAAEDVVNRIRVLAPEGMAHVAADPEFLAVGGSLAAYATGNPRPPVPFGELLFENVRVVFLGSDDFLTEAKVAAARDLNGALEAKWPGFETIQTFALSAIAAAHDHVEVPNARARAVVTLS